MLTIAQKEQTPSLYNPAARSTGHVHYAHYEVSGDDTTVWLDDCMGDRPVRMSTEAARKDWARRAALGWRRES